MQHAANESLNESLQETPVGGSVAIVGRLVSVSVLALGLEGLAVMIGLLLISPGCGPPT